MPVRPLLMFVLVLWGFIHASAQDAGQTLADVRRARGEPMMARKTGDTETWVYSDGTKVVFRDGVVAGAPKATNLTVDREEDETDNVTVVAGPPPVAAPVERASNAPSARSAEARSTFADEDRAETPMLINVIIIACGVAFFGANIWYIVVTFKQGLMWGLGCLFVPFVSLVFLFKFWEDAKAPFLTSIASGVAMFALAAGFSG